jgi:hypothetical protein
MFCTKKCFLEVCNKSGLNKKEAKRQDKTRQDKMQTFNVTDHRTPIKTWKF